MNKITYHTHLVLGVVSVLGRYYFIIIYFYL